MIIFTLKPFFVFVQLCPFSQGAQQDVLRPLLRPMLQRLLHSEAGQMILSATVGRAKLNHEVPPAIQTGEVP